MAETIATVGQLGGMCGHDGTGWEKILIDATKRLVVAVDAFTSAVEATQDTPGDLLTGIHGYDGAAWRKLPLTWGYSAVVSEFKYNTNMGAGTQNLDATAVPGGEVWVLNAFNFRIDSATCNYLAGLVVVGGVPVYMLRTTPPVSANWYYVVQQQALGAGDFVRLELAGLTAGDDAYIRYCGYKMRIDM